MIKYVIGFFIAVLGLMVYWMFYGMNEVKSLAIRDIDLSKIANGTYRGSYSKGRWSYNLSVTVEDHKIRAMRLLDSKMKMAEKPNMQQIDRVISSQSLRVDTVTGATVFSKALLKAIENALSAHS